MRPASLHAAHDAGNWACLGITLLALLLPLPPSSSTASIISGSPVGDGPPRGYTGPIDVTVETLAGTSPGFRDGPAWQSQFCGPNALALAPDGSLLICDSRNHRIRRYDAGVVTTVAGGGAPGGAGGIGVGDALDSARFRYPSGVAVDSHGTVYIADTGNRRLCRLREGVVSTVATFPAGSLPAALALEEPASVWTRDAAGTIAWKMGATGGPVVRGQPPQHIAARLGLEVGDEANWRYRGVFRDEQEHRASYRVRLASPGVAYPATGWELVSASDGLQTQRAPFLFRAFADPVTGTVLLHYAPERAAIVAGSAPGETGSLDGTGRIARMEGPCAVVMSPVKDVYVAEYAGSRIRKLTLPERLLSPGRPTHSGIGYRVE